MLKRVSLENRIHLHCSDLGKCLVLNLLSRAFFLDFVVFRSFYFTFIKVPLSSEQIHETAAIPASGSQRGSLHMEQGISILIFLLSRAPCSFWDGKRSYVSRSDPQSEDKNNCPIQENNNVLGKPITNGKNSKFCSLKMEMQNHPPYSHSGSSYTISC